MKVLISGANGFIGRNLAERFASKYEVLAPSRTELDLLDERSLGDYFALQQPDAVVHCAAVGVSRSQPSKGVKDLNFSMFRNLLSHSRHFGKLIQVGSGAEYGRQRALERIQEEEFGSTTPRDDYGLSKYLCAKEIENFPQNDGRIISLRLFGCYGKYEDYSTRFISNNLCRALSGLPVLIANRNALFDYLYVDDFARIVSHFLDKKKPAPHVFYNATPDSSVELLELARKISALHKDAKPAAAGRRPQPGIIVRNPGMGPAYTGDNSRLREELGAGFEFTPIDAGIRELDAWYRKNKKMIDASKLGPKE